jgi:hypothetical protein
VATRKLLENQNISNDQGEPETRRAQGVFLTEGFDNRNLKSRRGFSRKPQGSQRSARQKDFDLPPTERIFPNEKVTFIHHPTLEDNKSFNLVKCRQRLRELTDNRIATLRQKQEKKERQLEKYYKDKRK